MARYPTFDEYAKKGNYADGIKRCDELLARNPKDSQLLITKLQLLSASAGDLAPVLEQLLAISPPITDFSELVPIEAAVFDSLKNVYPPALTVGPAVSKLWDAAFKVSNSPKYKTDLISIRFDRAVVDNRIQDVQQSLITLKAFQPKNRAVYMAHAAYTQLLSSSKDDLQSKLAIGLARKAVSEKFDEDKALDCRVAGQIFAIQGTEKDLEGIRERTFRESKQVYDALKLSEPVEINGSAEIPTNVDPAKASSREWLLSEVEGLKKDFAKLIEDNAPANVLTKFIANSIRLFHTAISALDLGGRDRGAADACFLAISGLVKLFTVSNDTTYLLQATFLAERLLQYNQYVHEARLVLIYLYMRLSLGSLAMRLFDSLSVKEIQHDTVGHTLFSKISITHPFSTVFPSREIYSPLEKTHKALGVYPRHEDKLSETESNVLNHAQTGMIFDLQELRTNLRASLPRRMFLLEHRRIARLTGKAPGKNTSEIGPRVVANWINVKDNRDFNAAFDYGFNVETALYRDPSNSQPRLYNLAADTAWSLANKQQPLITDPQNLSAAITPSSENTSGIHLSGLLSLSLLPILETVRAGSSPTKESITSILTQTNKIPISLLTQSHPALAEDLSDHYVFLDLLRIVMQTCRFIKDHAEHIPVQVAEVQEVAKKGIHALQKHAQETATGLKSGDGRERMLKNEDLRSEMGLFGEEEIKFFAEKIAESAKEGWEGVGKITLL